MRSGDRLLASGLIVLADNQSSGGRRIGDFYCLFCRSIYGEVFTFKFSHSADLVRVKKRGIPNISPRFLIRTLTLRLSGVVMTISSYAISVCILAGLLEGDLRRANFRQLRFSGRRQLLNRSLHELPRLAALLRLGPVSYMFLSPTTDLHDLEGTRSSEQTRAHHKSAGG